jgi:DNA mismatch endonuclease (patch repair protein)
MDVFTKKKRSEIMSRIRSKNTSAELLVRKLCFRLGYRYRLHSSLLPGKPDLVFSRRKKVIFVHGCFWHRHSCKFGQRLPSSNTDYWTPKLNANAKRDKRHVLQLRKDGWKVLVLWECEIRKISEKSLANRLQKFLGKNAGPT